jgi:hypothetical protein
MIASLRRAVRDQGDHDVTCLIHTERTRIIVSGAATADTSSHLSGAAATKG